MSASLPPHPDLPRYYRPGDKPRFVRQIFDASAPHYERVEKLMSLGSGAWYRRRALRRHGLPCGRRGLDVAVGTGLLARQAARLAPAGHLLLGLDPSLGMLAQARRRAPFVFVAAVGERAPFRDASFHWLSMGYALRHLPDLVATFREFFRLLVPGGKLLILEITPPPGGLGRALMRAYIRTLTATAALVLTRHRSPAELWRYFWDTMETCVPPATVMGALSTAGFVQVDRFVELGIFSEYTAVKP